MSLFFHQQRILHFLYCIVTLHIPIITEVLFLYIWVCHIQCNIHWLELSFIFTFLTNLYLADTPPTQNTSKPVVKHEFSRKNGFIPYQFSNFKCVFPFLSSPNPNKTFLYQIYWYINGNTVFVTNAVKEEDFSKTLFNEDNGITRMGVQVCFIQITKCVYWLSFTYNNLSCFNSADILFGKSEI